MKTLQAVREFAKQGLPETTKKYGDKGFAYLCGFVPAEILHAAGLVPIRMRVTGNTSTEKGEIYFSQTHCSLVRHALDMGIREQFSHLGGILFSTACDHARRSFDAWRHANTLPAFKYIIAVPTHGNDVAVSAMRFEIMELAKALEKELNIRISSEALQASIVLFNTQRRLLGQIVESRKRKDCPITGTDMLAITQNLTSIPVEEGNALLLSIIDELKTASAPENNNKIRLFLNGGHFEDLRRLEIIEKHGGLVVQDLVCTATGHFHGTVNESSDPWTALATRTIRRLACPHLIDQVKSRLKFIETSVKEWQCDGIITDKLSFCGLVASELFVFKRHFRELNIPMLHLESELYGGGEGQLTTRVEAFAEQIMNRKNM